MAKTYPHKIDGGSSGDFWVKLPDAYDGIGTELGVTKISGTIPAGVKQKGLKEGITDGSLRRIHISYMVGNKRRVAKLVVSGDKADAAEGALTQGTSNIKRGTASYPIETVYFPTRRRLR